MGIKNILIQHHHKAGEISGVITYTEHLAQALRDVGLQADVISNRQNSLKDRLKMARKADVVHLNATDLPLALYCKVVGKPTILKYHYPFYRSTFAEKRALKFTARLKAEMVYNFPRPATSRSSWKFFTGITLRLATRLGVMLMADRLVACSDTLGKACALPRPVQTLYNPINIERGAVPKRLEEVGQPLQFVYAGRLDPEKGVDVLLAAAKQLHDEGLCFRLLVIGDGMEAAALEVIARDLGLGAVVRFAGKLPNAEVLAAIKSSIALVAPSRWEEPAGYVAVEAASMQTCPILSRKGGLQEMGGPDAMYFEAEDVPGLADRMRACLLDPHDALRRGRAVYERAIEQFAPARIADEFMAICYSLN